MPRFEHKPSRGSTLLVSYLDSNACLDFISWRLVLSPCPFRSTSFQKMHRFGTTHMTSNFLRFHGWSGGFVCHGFAVQCNIKSNSCEIKVRAKTLGLIRQIIWFDRNASHWSTKLFRSYCHGFTRLISLLLSEALPRSTVEMQSNVAQRDIGARPDAPAGDKRAPKRKVVQSNE